MFEAPKRELPSIGLTPLIDVVFILLIFVILAANFDRVRGLKVDLPEASTQKKPPKKSLIVTVNAKGNFYINQKIVPQKQLLTRLRNLRKKHSTLLLRADGKVALKHAIQVLDHAEEIGFESVSIATRRN